MVSSRLVTALLLLVLIPGLGHAQSREEPSWSEYPDALPPPPLTPVEESPEAQPPPAPEDSFEPAGFPERGAPPEVAAPPDVPVEEAASAPPPRDRHPMAPSVPEYTPRPPEPRSTLSLNTEPLAVPVVRGILEVSGGAAVSLAHLMLVELVTGTHCLQGGDRCALTVVLGTLATGGIAPLGASAVGAVLGGEGKLWAAYLGGAIGMGLGLVATSPTIAFDRGFAISIAGPIGAILGSAIGYELSHRWVMRGGDRLARSSGPAVRMVPVVGASAHGGLVGGMAGSF
jgi:hypothetical protein